MTIVYITAFIPFGRTESFVLEEISSIKGLFSNILIIPRNPSKEVFHQKAKELAKNALRLPLFNFEIVRVFFFSLLSLDVWKVLIKIVFNSRNFKICLKNLSIFPKSIYLSRILKEKNVGHIHAHWAGTTTTMAYIIHCLTGIPYSFTSHRWDIYENNMLKEKVNTAVFARCISIKGKNDVISIVGQEFEKKVQVLHLGVALPELIFNGSHSNKDFIVMTPANLLPVKGHQYMIEACDLLKKRGIKVRYWIVGDGELEPGLKKQVINLKLGEDVLFLGRVPHEKVMRMYQNKEVDLVVLPSINTNDAQHEGIPVALMEAMAYQIPVISTDTGSIPELLVDGGGLLVSEKSADDLADAVERLLKDKDLYNNSGVSGRRKIEKDFSENMISRRLAELFSSKVQK